MAETKRNEVKRSKRLAKSPRRMVSVYLSPEMYDEVVQIAEQLGIGLAAVGSTAIASYVRRWTPPLAKKGKPGQTNTQKWPSGWPVHTPCPAGGCTVNHDPAWHLTNEPRLVRTDNVRSAFAAAGLTVHLDDEED